MDKMNISDDNTDETAVEKENVSICANCGKEDDNLKSCTACKMVKYCNRECQIAHRPQHKKDCRRRVAELHDEKLFKQPPPAEDCPICFVRLPTLKSGYRYQSCCGKVTCSGCICAPLYDNHGNEVDNQKCPFCRTPDPSSDEEIVERLKKRVKANDARAIYNLGVCHQNGLYSRSQDYNKALELWHRAAEIGYANAYNNIGFCYVNGHGVEVDKEKALHYYELAAMKGDVYARYNLGNNEKKAGNIDKVLKHYMISTRGGYDGSLKRIKELYSNGYATKEEYMKALQAYQAYLGEIKSRQRDEAAAADEEYRYY